MRTLYILSSLAGKYWLYTQMQTKTNQKHIRTFTCSATNTLSKFELNMLSAHNMTQLGCFQYEAYDQYKEKISQHAWTVLGGALQASWPSHLHHWKSTILLHLYMSTSLSLKVYFVTMIFIDISMHCLVSTYKADFTITTNISNIIIIAKLASWMKTGGRNKTIILSRP